MAALPRDVARRFGRQIRLAGIGEAGQAKLCAAAVAPSASGFARVVEERYLRAAGVGVQADAALAVDDVQLPDLGFRHAPAREVGDGAIRALVAIRRILEAPDGREAAPE